MEPGKVKISNETVKIFGFLFHYKDYCRVKNMNSAVSDNGCSRISEMNCKLKSTRKESSKLMSKCGEFPVDYIGRYPPHCEPIKCRYENCHKRSSSNVGCDNGLNPVRFHEQEFYDKSQNKREYTHSYWSIRTFEENYYTDKA